MRESWPKKLERTLILPSALHVGSWLLAALTLAVVAAGGAFVPSGYSGVAASDSVEDICAPAAREKLRAEEGRSSQLTECTKQLTARALQLCSHLDELALACRRSQRFRDDLSEFEPLTRQSLREEEAEVRRQFVLARELIGPQPLSELCQRLVLTLVTLLVGLAAIHGIALHARAVGIPRLAQSARVRTPLLLSAAVTLLVALGVARAESMDPDKTGYDWSSYCLAGSLSLGRFATAGWAFWLEHATLLTLSGFTAIQIAAGWHVTNAGFVPRPKPSKPYWGVGRYVRLLQVWTFLIVVSVGLITAVWIRGLVASRTNITSFFLGFGALPPVACLVCRLICNALRLRERCEKAGARCKLDKLPADPTEGLLAASWWQVPTLFASAFAIAAALLEWGGVAGLLGAR